MHEDFINDFAWAQPQMKLVTVCDNGSSNLCNVHPSGDIIIEKNLISISQGFSVSFSPGSSGMY